MQVEFRIVFSDTPSLDEHGQVFSMRYRWDPSLRHVATPWILAALLAPTLALLAFIALQPWVPIAHLVRDPLVVAEEAAECCSVYYGAVSNLGVVLWFITATACLLLAVQSRLARLDPGLTGFFAAGGLFSLWLGLDDLFLIHDDVLPVFGIPQPVTYALYAASGVAYLLFSWRTILAGRVSLFLLSGLCLAASMGLDAAVHVETPFWIYLEDALKFAGIVLWTGFHLASALGVSAEVVAGGMRAGTASRIMAVSPQARAA